MSTNLMTYRLHRARSLTAVSALVFGLSLGGAAIGSAHATDAADVKEEISETLDAIKDYSADKRDEAVTAGSALIDKLDARIEALERKAENASDSVSDATREQWKDTKAGLVKMREKAAMQLASMRESSTDAWSKAKHGFSEAVDDLGEAIEDAGEKMQK